MKYILDKSDNNINNTIWMMEMYKFNVTDTTNWKDLLNKIVEMIMCEKNYSMKNMLNIIKDTRELLYILFITNIDFHTIIRKLMLLFINKVDNINIKYNIIEVTSTFELRIAQGTRYIIHMEAYLIKIIYIMNIFYKNQKKYLNKLVI
jgi:hypothetical protein